MCHQLDHEKLDVYPLELAFVAWAADLIVELHMIEDDDGRRTRTTEDDLPKSGTDLWRQDTKGF